MLERLGKDQLDDLGLHGPRTILRILDGIAWEMMEVIDDRKVWRLNRLGKDQLDDLGLHGPRTILRILDGIAWEMMEVIDDRKVWRLNLELLPSQPSPKSGKPDFLPNSKKLRVVG